MPCASWAWPRSSAANGKLALAMSEFLLHDLGATDAHAQSELQRLREELE